MSTLKPNLKFYQFPLCLAMLSIIFFSNCKNKSNPSLEESDLINKIEADSIIIENTIEEYNFSPDSNRIHFAQKESRQENNQVRIIDLSKDPKTIRDVKLSEIASKVQYIKLKPDDSTYFTMDETNFQFYKNYIIAHNLQATTIFDLNGNHKDYIAKNEINMGRSPSGEIYFITDGFSGMYYPPVVYKDKLYYLYKDKNSNRSALCRFYLETLNGLKTVNTSEIQSAIKGEPILSVGGGFMNGINQLQILDDNSWFGVNAFWTSFKENKLMYSFSMEGDTTTTFNNFDPVLNYGGGAYRTTENRSLYKLNDKLMYRQAYNDTIYRILSTSRMVSEYILFRGDKGLTTREGMSSRTNLAGKIIIDQIYETNNWMLIVTSNNQNSPNNKRKEIVQFSYWFYNKLTGELIKTPGEFKDEKKELINDLDNGMNFWPSQATNEGWLLKGFLVKDLKNKYSLQELQERFPFNEFNDDEYILMIVK